MAKISHNDEEEEKSELFGKVSAAADRSRRSSSVFASNLDLMGKQLKKNKGKKTLVLNLDETLIHSVFEKDSNPDCTFSILFNKEYYLVSTHKRPYLDEFLKRVSKDYEIVFYSSGVEGYANNVIDYIDPNSIASARLFRDACINEDNVYIKELNRLGRDLASTIILDNSPTAYKYNIENAIPVKTWFTDQKDTELLDLIPILESLAKVPDVRVIINKIILKMSSAYGIDQRLDDQAYIENIPIEDREKYIQVVGNYNILMDDPDIDHLPVNYQRDNTMETSNVRFSNEEVNAFVFNHLHCKYSNENEKADVLIHNSNPSGKVQRRRNRLNVDGFGSKKSHKEYNYGNNSMFSHQNSYKGNRGKTGNSELSGSSFEKNIYKNLEDPSSYSESIKSEQSQNFQHHKSEAKKSKKNDELRTFLCLDS